MTAKFSRSISSMDFRVKGHIEVEVDVDAVVIFLAQMVLAFTRANE